jgi:hypothetical protein
MRKRYFVIFFYLTRDSSNQRRETWRQLDVIADSAAMAQLLAEAYVADHPNRYNQPERFIVTENKNQVIIGGSATEDYPHSGYELINP